MTDETKSHVQIAEQAVKFLDDLLDPRTPPNAQKQPAQILVPTIHLEWLREVFRAMDLRPEIAKLTTSIAGGRVRYDEKELPPGYFEGYSGEDDPREPVERDATGDAFGVRLSKVEALGRAFQEALDTMAKIAKRDVQELREELAQVNSRMRKRERSWLEWQASLEDDMLQDSPEFFEQMATIEARLDKMNDLLDTFGKDLARLIFANNIEPQGTVELTTEPSEPVWGDVYPAEQMRAQAGRLQSLEMNVDLVHDTVTAMTRRVSESRLQDLENLGQSAAQRVTNIANGHGQRIHENESLIQFQAQRVTDLARKQDDIKEELAYRLGQVEKPQLDRDKRLTEMELVQQTDIEALIISRVNIVAESARTQFAEHRAELNHHQELLDDLETVGLTRAAEIRQRRRRRREESARYWHPAAKAGIKITDRDPDESLGPTPEESEEIARRIAVDDDPRPISQQTAQEILADLRDGQELTALTHETASETLTDAQVSGDVTDSEDTGGRDDSATE